jgi:hypothetical protein
MPEKQDGTATCNGCDEKQPCVIYQDLQIHESTKNTPWVRPPRGWFVTTVFFRQDVDGIQQMRCMNIFVCPRCMASGRIRPNADAARDDGEKVPASDN